MTPSPIEGQDAKNDAADTNVELRGENKEVERGRDLCGDGRS